nr:MAG TPA: hypothetical protein [Bacteriophage sp.]
MNNCFVRVCRTRTMVLFITIIFKLINDFVCFFVISMLIKVL